MSLLQVDGISVRFGGLQALRAVNLDAGPGTVTGLIGPNGAGKTTLFNVICGYQAATAGRVLVDGQDISGKAPHRRARLGIARTFQRLETFGSMTARDNIRVAAEVRRRWSRDRSDVETLTDEIIELVGLGAVAGEQVDAMPTGLARLVELGRALATRPRILLLDEPSSGLDESESAEFGRLLLRLAEGGTGVLLVEHDIDLVMAVCSTIFVLDFGSILASGPPAEIQRNPAVRAAYLGVGDEAERLIEEEVEVTPA
ncbi:MAG TPA: ABC transporter ATP-binding protein [Acidimicrobiales bacterium]|nr:ABC transporter ATP-binding protein [Acidimicrobiales bacterium]